MIPQQVVQKVPRVEVGGAAAKRAGGSACGSPGRRGEGVGGGSYRGSGGIQSKTWHFCTTKCKIFCMRVTHLKLEESLSQPRHAYYMPRPRNWVVGDGRSK